MQFFCYSAPARSVEFGARCAQHTEPVYHYHNGTPAQLQTLCGLKVRRVFICEGVYSKGCPAQRQAASSGVSPCLAADASAPLSNIPAGPTVPREEGRGGVEAWRRGMEATRRGGRKQEGASAAPRARRPSPRRSTQMNHYLQINMPKGHCAATSCSTDARGRLARSLGPASSEALMPWRQALMPCFRVLNYVAGLAREVG